MATEGRTIQLNATATFKAAQGGQDGPPRFSMLANTGGLINVAGFPSPVAVDLAGLQGKREVPILADHQPSQPIGHGSATVRSGQLHAEGVLSIPGELTERVRGGARNGFPWKASIGASVVKARKLPAGEQAEVNGKTITAPAEGAYVIEQSKLNEISILALAADGQTSVGVTGQQHEHGGETMKRNTTEQGTKTAEQIRAEATAEAQRIADIRERCGERQPKIVAQAINEEWTPDQAELAVIRAERPQVPHVAAGHTAALTRSTLEAAVLMRAGRPDLAEQLGDQACTGGERFRHIADIAAAACRLDGRDVTAATPDQLFTAAFSTVSMPTALGAANERILADAFEDQPALWRHIAAVRDVPNLHPHTVLRLTDMGGFRQIAPTGEVGHGSIDEDAGPKMQVDTFGEVLSFTRKAMINDEVGAIGQVSEGLGRNAARGQNDLVAQTMRDNADSFFGVSNGNLKTGSDTALAFASLSTAVQTMKEMTDPAGNPIDIQPRFLVVPPALESTARQLVISDEMARYTSAGTDNQPAGNPMYKQIIPLTEARLGAGYEGGSDKAWYLLGQTSAQAIIVAFLMGQRRPRLEFFGIDSQPNVLAATWRCYQDYGVALVEPRAAIKMKGEA